MAARPAAALARPTTAMGGVSRSEPEREKDTASVISAMTAARFEAANHGLARTTGPDPGATDLGARPDPLLRPACSPQLANLRSSYGERG